MPEATPTLILTAQITAAWLSAHPLAEDVATLVLDVHKALTGCLAPAVAVSGPLPAVPLRRSVFQDHIVCLECGGKFRTLKKHLTETHQLGAAAYRRKWGLPTTYPMLAPEYAVLRSKLAKDGEMWKSRRRG